MTSLPKGYVIPRLKAGHQSVVVRDGQNRAAITAAGCDSRQQLFSKNVDSFYRARCKHCKNFHDANSYCFRLRRFSSKMPRSRSRSRSRSRDRSGSRSSSGVSDSGSGHESVSGVVSQFIRTKQRRLSLTNTGLQLTCVSLTSSTARGRGLMLLRRSWCFRPPLFRCTSVSCSAMES